MPALGGSKTEQNLKDAFAGESQANRRYLYFARKADVEGHNDVSALFRSTAEGETGHAHGHLDFLVETGDPATGKPIGITSDNLVAAVAGETHEYTDMYPGMARTARDEGFDEIADWFETLAKAEKSHAGRFQKGARLARLEPRFFRPNAGVAWACSRAQGRRLAFSAGSRAGQAKDLGIRRVDAGRAECLQVARARVLAEHGGDAARLVMAGHGDVPAQLAEMTDDREVAEAGDQDAVRAVGDAGAWEPGRQKRRLQHGEGGRVQHLPGEEGVKAPREGRGES